MAKTQRKYRFLDEHRIGENESWLTDMAARGLHLKSIGTMFAYFEQGEPERVRYRIDFMSKQLDKGDDVQRKLYAECGWQYVCTQNDMRVFRAPDGSDASEPHTDSAEHAFTLQRLRRRHTWNGVVVVLMYAAILYIMGSYAFFDPTPTLTFVEGSMVNMPFLVLLILFISITVAGSARSIRKLTRSLSEGGKIDHNAKWKRLYRTRVISMAILLCIMAPLTIGLPFATMAISRTETLPLENNAPSIVRLADIENTSSLERKDGARLTSGVDWSNSVSHRWSPYAQAMTVVREQGVVPGRMWADGSGEYSPDITCSTYKLRFSWLVDGVLDDLMKLYEISRDQGTLIEAADRQGFDRLYIRDEQSRIEVFASKGNSVVWLLYFGEAGAQSVIDAIPF